MIRLRLQLFAKSASYMRAYRKSKAIQKQALETKKPSGGESSQTQQSESPKASALSRATGRLTAKEIVSRETYTLYRVGGQYNEIEKEFGDRTGSQIRDSLAYGKLRYDSKAKVWISQKGLKYIVRKKKR